jgi:hypothetical protein
MKFLKCNCGSESVRVETRDDCRRCADNRCENECEDEICCVIAELCAFKGRIHECRDFDSRADCSHECAMGDTNNAGCWIVTCALCGKHVEYLPMANV